MSNNIVADSASRPFIKAANVHVTQDGDGVAVRVAFSGIEGYTQAREILKQQEGWRVAEHVELEGSRFNLHASVSNVSVPTVADRLRMMGIATLSATPAQP